MKILVTGSAGFIGNEVCLRLLDSGHRVIGLDSLNSYYDVGLKRARMARIENHSNFIESRIDLADRPAVASLFSEHEPEVVVNMAAQAGVRYSLTHPHSYVDSNLVGFVNILEGCRAVGVRHLVFASSSSVYGTNTVMPFSEHAPADHPISIYAATKRANELLAHSYSHLFGIPATGLRLFTVYGPWGRPDMAPILFARAISEGRSIDVFNQGRMRRSFTYIDDITESIIRLLDRVPEPVAPDRWNPERPDPSQSHTAPFRVFNVGSRKADGLMHFIEVLETCLGRKAVKNMLPMQDGDMEVTWADVTDLETAISYEPAVGIEEGVRRFAEWYLSYYGSVK